MWLQALVAAHLAMLAACIPEVSDTFSCHSDLQCTSDGQAGHCEENATCSFDDSSCASGRRYGDLAAEGLAGICHDGAVSANLVANGHFEEGVSGWFGFQATVAVADTAHTGDQSAGVCVDATENNYAINDTPATVSAPDAGGVFRASAWVRAAGDLESARVQIVIREVVAGSGGESTNSPSMTIGQEWQKITVAHTFTQSSEALDLYIAGFGTEGCFLVDDIALFRVY